MGNFEASARKEERAAGEREPHSHSGERPSFLQNRQFRAEERQCDSNAKMILVQELRMRYAMHTHTLLEDV